MTDFQKYFVDQLDYYSLIALETILRNKPVEGLDYVTGRLDELSMNKEIHEQALELSKEIPMHYVPMLGVNLKKKPWKNWSIYHYREMPIEEKVEIAFFNPFKVSNLDYSVDFLLNHLENRIRICKKELHLIPSGIDLLDQDLEEKRQLVDELLEDKIFEFFFNFEKEYEKDDENFEYIFWIKKSKPILELYLHGSRRIQLIELLARYSDLEDLKSENIKSFQKFIREKS